MSSSSSSSTNPLLLAAQALLSHSKSSSSSSSSSSAIIDHSIPQQLIDRFASHSRIRSLAKVFDKDAEIEDGAVEVIDKLLTYFVEDWTQMASEVALARTDPSIDCGVGGVSSGGSYTIGPSALLSGPPVLTVNDFHAYISPAYPFIVLPTDEIATHLTRRGPPVNAVIDPLMHKNKIAALPADREAASSSAVASKGDVLQTSAISATSNLAGKEKEKLSVSFAVHGGTSNVESDKKGAGGKRKRGGTTTATALNESSGKAEEKRVIEDIDDDKTTLPQPVSSIAPKFKFKMKVPAATPT